MKKINANNAIFCLVDVQEKLFPHMHNKEDLVKNLEILTKGLQLLNVPILASEQYKKGIGQTIESLRAILKDCKYFEKTLFSCCCEDFMNTLKNSNKTQIIVAGIETHICVLQTCLDLLSCGCEVFLVTNCCSSRKEEDSKIAFKRLIQAGAIPTTYESLLFELIKDAKHQNFKEISTLIR